MAIGGQRPTPNVVKLVTGNPGRRPVSASGPAVEGKPVRRPWLNGRGAEIWDEVLVFAYWLTIADSYKLAAWCDREAEFEKPTKRKKWTAADRREHRSLGSELGLDITALTRMGGIKKPDAEKKDPAAKYIG